MSVKTVLKTSAVRTLASGPIWGTARRLERRGRAAVFMYHEIGDASESTDAWQVVRESDFLRQVDWLRREFRLVSLDEAQREVCFGSVESRRAAVLTFDDGHRGLASRLLPALRREGIPATVYVSTEHIATGRPYWFDRVVNALQDLNTRDIDLARFGLGAFRLGPCRGPARWADIQRILLATKRLDPNACEDVADEITRQTGLPPGTVLVPLGTAEVAALAAEPLVTLGCHSHGHEVLTQLAPDVCRASIRLGRELLESWTGRRARHFAYPAGFYDSGVEAIVRSEGFDTAMSTKLGIWSGKTSLFAIPRISVGRYDSLDQIRFNYLVACCATGGTRQAGLAD